MVNFNPGINFKNSFPNLYGGPQKPGDPDPTGEGQSKTGTSSSSGAKGFAEKAKKGELGEEFILQLMKSFGIQPSGDKAADMKKLVAKMSGNEQAGQKLDISA